MLTGIINEIRAIDIQNIAWRVLSRHKDDLIALQQSRLHEGKKTDGQYISPYTSKSHINLRKKLGKQTAVKDLDLYGNHYKDMYAITTNSYTEMGSNDWKELILESNWGKDIYGLSDEQMSYTLYELGLAEEMAQEFQMEIFRYG